MRLAVLAAALTLTTAATAVAFEKPRWKDPGHPDAFPKNFGYKDPHPPLFPKDFGYKPPKEERRSQKVPSLAPDFGSDDRVYVQRNRRGKETFGDKREPFGGGKPFDIVR